MFGNVGGLCPINAMIEQHFRGNGTRIVKPLRQGEVSGLDYVAALPPGKYSLFTRGVRVFQLSDETLALKLRQQKVVLPL